MMKKSNQKEMDGKAGILLKHSTVGAFLGMFITLLIIFAVSMLMVSGALSETLCDSFIIVSVLVGTTISGLYCAGKQGRGVVTAGVVAAAMYVILLLLGTMLFRKSGGGAALILKEMIAAVAGGCFGGVLRLYKKGKKSKLRK